MPYRKRKRNINKMETKKILLWWFLYSIVGSLIALGIGFMIGIIGGFTAAVLGLPLESAPPLLLIIAGICGAISNFFVFKWAVGKILD